MLQDLTRVRLHIFIYYDVRIKHAQKKMKEKFYFICNTVSFSLFTFYKDLNVVCVKSGHAQNNTHCIYHSEKLREGKT